MLMTNRKSGDYALTPLPGGRDFHPYRVSVVKVLALPLIPQFCTDFERTCRTQAFCVKGKFREETFPQIQWQIGSVRPSSHELALSIS